MKKNQIRVVASGILLFFSSTAVATAAPIIGRRASSFDRRENAAYPLAIAGRQNSLIQSWLLQQRLLAAAVNQRIANQNAIAKIYRDVLGRAVDKSGLETWLNAISKGVPLAQVRKAIAKSPESQGNVNRIYQEVLARNAEPAGLDAWTNYLAAGGTLAGTRAGIAKSPESQGNIDQLYQDILGRHAEPAGLTAWTNYLTSGGTLAGARTQIAKSPETMMQLDGIYYGMGQGSASGHYDQWANALAAGATLADVRRAVALTPETARAVVSTYVRYLGREPVGGEVQTAIGQFAEGTNSYWGLRAGILGSDEYQHRILPTSGFTVKTIGPRLGDSGYGRYFFSVPNYLTVNANLAEGLYRIYDYDPSFKLPYLVRGTYGGMPLYLFDEKAKTIAILSTQGAGSGSDFNSALGFGSFYSAKNNPDQYRAALAQMRERAQTAYGWATNQRDKDQIQIVIDALSRESFIVRADGNPTPYYTISRNGDIYQVGIQASVTASGATDYTYNDRDKIVVINSGAVAVRYGRTEQPIQYRNALQRMLAEAKNAFGILSNQPSQDPDGSKRSQVQIVIDAINRELSGGFSVVISQMNSGGLPSTPLYRIGKQGDFYRVDVSPAGAYPPTNTTEYHFDSGSRTVMVVVPGSAPVTYTAAANPDQYRQALTRMRDSAQAAQVFFQNFSGQDPDHTKRDQIQIVIDAINRELT